MKLKLGTKHKATYSVQILLQWGVTQPHSSTHTLGMQQAQGPVLEGEEGTHTHKSKQALQFGISTGGRFNGRPCVLC